MIIFAISDIVQKQPLCSLFHFPCPLFFEAVSSVFCAITDEEIIVAINQNAMCLFFIMP